MAMMPRILSPAQCCCSAGGVDRSWQVDVASPCDFHFAIGSTEFLGKKSAVEASVYGTNSYTTGVPIA